jgi:putative redox protein
MGPVVVKAGNSFRNEIEIGKHRLIVDEPGEAGGGDEGPTPYDLLSSALGSCTSMTMHFLAKRDNIPLTGAEVIVTNDRMYAKDCSDCMSKSGYIHRFTVRIKLHGDLTPEHRERLLRAAKHCPVYKTLSSEIRIDEELIENEGATPLA